MDSIAHALTRKLYQEAKDGLALAKEEKNFIRRQGLIIQSLYTAINRTHIYSWGGIPHMFTGKIYEPCDPKEFKGVIFDVLDRNYADMPSEDLTHIQKIQRICLESVWAKPLNLRKDIIVFENCVLCMGDLREGIDPRKLKNMTPEELKRLERVRVPHERKRAAFTTAQHSPTLAQITMCHFDYDPTAVSERWLQFMDEVLPNKQTQMVLQEFLGCIFIDRRQAKIESMCILLGNGANGKSVVADTVRGIIGDDSMTSYGLDSILTGGDSTRNIAKMNGMRLNYCTEIQAVNAGKYSDKLKTIISGEPFECRAMYGDPFTARDIPLMMANCNTLPPIEDSSYGMQRRFIIIRFDVTIATESQDKQLTQKLYKERAAIFNWIMEGRQRFVDQAFQFTKSKVVDSAMESYIQASDNVQEFLLVRRFTPTPTDILQQEPYSVQDSSIYDDYRRWCISSNASPFSKKRFVACIKKQGFGFSRNSTGYVFNIYGEGAFAAQTRNRAAQVNSNLLEKGVILDGQEVSNGVLLDIGDSAASRHCHVSRPLIINLRKKGSFDGLWTYEKRTFTDKEQKRTYTNKMFYVYDHRRLLMRLEALGAYDEKDQPLSLRRQDANRRARAFNEEMERIGEPFRKFIGRESKDVSWSKYVIVDPDWEYTPDNVLNLQKFIVNAKIRETEMMDMAVTKDGKVQKAYFIKKKKSLASVVEMELATLESRGAADAAADISVQENDVKEVDFDDESLIIG